MAFHEERFPVNLSFGALGGPERRTQIVTLANGHEERNTPWQHSRRRYDAGLGLRSLDDMEKVVAFFEARRGPLHAFRWKDWADYKSSRPSEDLNHMDQDIAIADGQTASFQLSKTYGLGPTAYSRPILKPVEGTVTIGVEGDLLREETDFTLDLTTGIVTLNFVPVAGAAISAGFEFDVPARFDTDRISTSVATFQAGEIPDIPVVEVRL
ncbi:DUF2460 domain-containing protein [Maribius pontilimi]|uniref:DUF2460 domain-containing protein n=1 Tax=Palleronia pontilimi TaxID=1964209 RepID=A0A934I801_9RHOB|nr:DUF2460 domain-containing protein [Palleronia pontilimi]MBJ3761933.1 DUF2460 domain-containing protein [Palleronia pontilimi]